MTFQFMRWDLKKARDAPESYTEICSCPLTTYLLRHNLRKLKLRQVNRKKELPAPQLSESEEDKMSITCTMSHLRSLQIDLPAGNQHKNHQPGICPLSTAPWNLWRNPTSALKESDIHQNTSPIISFTYHQQPPPATASSRPHSCYLSTQHLGLFHGTPSYSHISSTCMD